MVDWPPRANVKMVLFLCTFNYYRSRFAEELFNHEAERDSSSLDSSVTRPRLGARDKQRRPHRAGRVAYPKRVDDQRSRRRSVPATMHGRRFGRRRFRGGGQRSRNIGRLCESGLRNGSIMLDYWNIHDVEDAAPAEALKLLTQQVITLLQQFRAATV